MKPPAEYKVMPVRECVAPMNLIETPEQVFEYWQNNIPKVDWYDPCKEAFVVLLLNTRKRILGHNLVTLGSLDSCVVTVLSVFRPAFFFSAHALILAHNHPSGNPEPSQADIKVTRDLIRAGQLLKIEVLDHVVVGATFCSMRALGYLSV